MKKKSWQIIVSGVGGQGLLLSGSLLGSAAAIYEGKKAVMTADYGSEARGTFTKADTIVSEEYIDFPEVLHADVIVALAEVAYNRYVDEADETMIILYNSDQITEKPSRAKQVGVAFDKLAAVDNKRGPINMVSLGSLVAITGVVQPESVEKSLRDRFGGKEKVLANNLDAFHKGMNAV